MPSEDTETAVKKNGAIPEIREEVIYCILGKHSKKKNCEGSEYGPIGGGGGLEKSLLIVNLW